MWKVLLLFMGALASTSPDTENACHGRVTAGAVFFGVFVCCSFWDGGRRSGVRGAAAAIGETKKKKESEVLFFRISELFRQSSSLL